MNERGRASRPGTPDTLTTTDESSQDETTAIVKAAVGMTADGQLIADWRYCFGDNQARGWRQTLHLGRVA